MPRSKHPTRLVLAALLVAGWLFGLGHMAPALALAQSSSSAVPVYDADRPASPLFPWTPQEQLYDWLDVSRTWNLNYRGGRFQVGLVGQYNTFTTVASANTTITPVPVGIDPSFRDPDIHNADLIDTHFTLQIGFTVVESLRLRLGLGASLTQIKADPQFEPLITVETDEYRRYGWGFNTRIGLEWAPVLEFLPTWMLPVFEGDILAWTGKNGEGYGTLNAMMMSVNFKLFFEVLNNPQEGMSFSFYLGLGYHHYAGFIDLPSGRTQEFSSPGGDGSELPFGDVDLLVGLYVMFDDKVGLRLEGASGVPAVRLTFEVIGE